MTPAAWLLLFTVFVWAVFLAARRRFLDAMIDARLAEVRHAAYRLEQLAAQGKVDRDSAFYRYFRRLGIVFGSAPPRALPGIAGLVAARLYRREGRDAAEFRELSRRAIDEMTGCYREHRAVVDAMMFNLIDAWRYRSLPLWGFTQLVRLVGATYNAFELVNAVFSATSGASKRPAAAAG